CQESQGRLNIQDRVCLQYSMLRSRMQSSRAFRFCTLLKLIAEGCKGLSVSSRPLPRKLLQHHHACYHEMLDCLLEDNPKDAFGMPQFHQEGFRILLLSDEAA